MNRSQAKARLIKLRQLIDDYRYNYHVLNKSIMSEAAADSLKRELTDLEKQYPELITADSPSQRVAGQPLPQFESAPHRHRMLSLNDVFNSEELEAWFKRIEKMAGTEINDFFADVKMDGFATTIIYQDGQLSQALTRGDGYNGEVITANIRTLESVPLRLRESLNFMPFLSGRTEIRGEVLMYDEDFQELNRRQVKFGLAEFKNPRNTAAGTMRQLDPALVAERKLHFHAYDVIRDEPAELPTHASAYEAAKELGFIVNEAASRLTSKRDLINFIKKWESEREKLPFNTDGVVVKVNDRDIYQRLGVAGKAPRGAVAYKYPAEEATTKVKDIIISVGRQGTATPVAVLEPVDVAGSTVTHASLHNEDELNRLGIRIGDTVIVHKAGDIIPKITRVLEDLRTGNEKRFDFSKELDKHPLEFKREPGEAAWRAVNRDNPLVLKRELAHFASKGALDIEGLGEKNVEQLVDAGLVKDAADFYALQYEDVLGLEGFAEVSSRKLLESIKAKSNPPLERFLVALGIRHIGSQTAIDLAERFRSLEAIADTAQNHPEQLYEVEGIGQVVAHSIAEWFADDKNLALLDKFRQLGVWPQAAQVKTGVLGGKSFAITGSLEQMSRDEAAQLIRDAGGTFQSSLGKNTDYLVVGSSGGGSKLSKARQLGTEIIDEAKLMEMVG